MRTSSLVLIFSGILGAAVACTFLNEKMNLPDDHIGEEILEGVIERELGVEVDLSPSSPEE